MRAGACAGLHVTKPRATRCSPDFAIAAIAARRRGRGSFRSWGSPALRVRFSGETRQFRSKSFRGTDAVRNFCPACGGLVFGGEVGKDTSHTIYAGSLDDPALFHPTIAIFVRDRPEWVVISPDLTLFDTLPD